MRGDLSSFLRYVQGQKCLHFRLLATILIKITRKYAKPSECQNTEEDGLNSTKVVDRYAKVRCVQASKT